MIENMNESREFPQEVVKTKKKSKTTKLLIGVIVILVLFLAYYFVLSPMVTEQLNGFIQEKQQEGAIFFLEGMLQQINETGFVNIPFGDRSLILVPYNPQGGFA